MAQTVRIDEATHTTLRQLAENDGVSLQEELSRAVQARRRELFFASIDAAYTSRSADERADDQSELELWDQTLSDGGNE